MNPYHYVAFDPGQKTGLATFNEEGGLTGVDILRVGGKGIIDWFEETFDNIPKLPQHMVNTDKCILPQVIICENYRIKNYDHQFSTVPTIRIIGIIEGYAYRCGAKFVEQESTVYKTGIKWSGNTVPKGHVPDHLSALGHGVYYLHKVEKKWQIKL